MDLLLRGTIITPEGSLPDGWVAARDGRIAAIGSAGDAAPAAAQVIDHGNALIMPGVVDGQTHATSCRGMAGIADATCGALAGGITTLVDMPYDNPAPLDRAERLAAKIAAIDVHAHTDMALYATVTRETGVSEMAALIDGGICAFKISSFESSPTRFPRIGTDLTLAMMEQLADSAVPIGLHNEDQEIVLAGTAHARAAGQEGIIAHAAARPMAAELAATAQFLALAQATGAHAHPVHLSGAEGFAQIMAFAGLGARVTGETCVHYLWFDAERDGTRLGPRMKVNPPIRSGRIEGLWAAITGGQVAFTSSDHSSWPIENKLAASIFDAGAGVPGLQTLLPAFFTAAQARGLDAAQLTADQLSVRPARFFGLADKGGIIRGKDADFAVLTPDPFVFDAATAQDGLRWSPFHGETFAVRVTATYLRGVAVWDGRAILNQPGAGHFIPRRGPGWFST